MVPVLLATSKASWLGASRTLRPIRPHRAVDLGPVHVLELLHGLFGLGIRSEHRCTVVSYLLFPNRCGRGQVRCHGGRVLSVPSFTRGRS